MKTLWATLCAAMLATPVSALTAQQIADRSSAAVYYSGKDLRGNISMTITDRQGRSRSRALVMLRRDLRTTNGDQKMYVYFTRPGDVKRTAFLVWKKVKAADDRWLYLPALDQVRRIAAGDERTSFVGSHFFYEDVSGRLPDEDRHVLTDQNATYYVLKSTPRDPSKVEFGWYISYIERRSFLPTRVEFYKPDGAMYRVMEVQAVQTIQGIPTITQMKMSDSDIGGSTTLRFRNVRYDSGLSDAIFTERALRNPPMGYLH